MVVMQERTRMRTPAKVVSQRVRVRTTGGTNTKENMYK